MCPASLNSASPTRVRIKMAAWFDVFGDWKGKNLLLSTIDAF